MVGFCHGGNMPASHDHDNDVNDNDGDPTAALNFSSVKSAQSIILAYLESKVNILTKMSQCSYNLLIKMAFMHYHHFIVLTTHFSGPSGDLVSGRLQKESQPEASWSVRPPPGWVGE